MATRKNHPGISACIGPLLLLLTLSVCSFKASATNYTIQPIGPADRHDIAAAINDAGTVAMYVLAENDPINDPDSPNYTPGYVCTIINGNKTLLTDLGGYYSEVRAINSSGQTIGFATPGSVPFEAGLSTLLWDSSGQQLYEFQDTNFFGPFGINDQGTVAGELDGSPYLITSEGEPISLVPWLSEDGVATDINNSGVIVGSATLPGKLWEVPYALDNGVVTELGLKSGTAWAINEHGQIAGTGSGFDGEYGAFFYDPTDGVTFLDELEEITYATDINDEGVVVGEISREGLRDAFIHDSENGMQELLSLLPSNTGWERLYSANSINNHGQIVGSGVFQGELRSYLITPIPEPGALALLSFSMVLLNRTRRRCR